jgi:hypothetical protein
LAEARKAQIPGAEDQVRAAATAHIAKKPQDAAKVKDVTDTLGVLTLKRRAIVWREIPLPPWLMAELDAHFGIAEAQRDPVRSRQRLWAHHRVTGWRIIKDVMMLSQIVGRAACPRGLRHSFGVGTLQAGAPLNMVQRWLGHSRISTTAIYTAACGPEDIELMDRFWRTPALIGDRTVAEIDPLNRIIGANMRRLRHARGMTQAKLGAFLPVSLPANSEVRARYQRCIRRRPRKVCDCNAMSSR